MPRVRPPLAGCPSGFAVVGPREFVKAGKMALEVQGLQIRTPRCVCVGGGVAYVYLCVYVGEFDGWMNKCV